MEEHLKSRLETMGISVLQASRKDLYLSMRFLDIALGALGYRMYLGTRTVATDGVDILYNPRHLLERYQEHPVLVNRMYLHMLLHCIFRHMLHSDEYDKEYWDIACDIAVESIIDSLDVTSVAWGMSDERRSVYDTLEEELKVLTAEGIYRALQRQRMSFEQLKQLQREFCVCDHSIWEELNKHSDDSEDSSDSNLDPSQESNTEEEQKQQEWKKQLEEHNKQQRKEQKDQEWETIREKMQTSLETFSRSIGAEFAGMNKALQSVQRSNINYKEFLQKFAVRQEVLKEDLDEFDYGYYTYGMQLYKNMPLIEPLEYKEEKRIQEFVIVMDTSGSCSGKLIRRFLKESFQILSSQDTFADQRTLHLIQCDDQVQSDVCITNQEELSAYMDDFEVKGLGSTDFRPAFEYVADLIQKKELTNLKGLIYFTDGYGTYPSKRPSYDVAFVFVGDLPSQVEVPPWAMKLVLETEGEGIV